MAKVLHLLLVCYSLMLLTSLICARADEERKVYIVYMGSLPRNQQYTPSSHHVSLLQKIARQSFSENLMVRSYNRSFNGFAARLTSNEAEELSGVEGVVSIFPDENYKLSTTRSWDFLGFHETANRVLQPRSEIIVGFIDSGIWPELPSFSDKGFGLPPKKWKGSCKGGKNFTCNNKVIGARYYGKRDSARDTFGHGSHTASIAAGVSVKDTSFYGLAQGTVRGGAPSARIAVYSACDQNCSTVDILAAFDDAIADGVDILSVSLNPSTPVPLEKDIIAIGAFHAMAKGVLTSNSAGNDGNAYGSVSSVAPWMISAAASSTDRRLVDRITLGNGMIISAISINSFDLNETMYPLVYYGNLSESRRSRPRRSLSLDDESSYKGKIAVYNHGDAYTGVSLGAVGAIYMGDLVDEYVSFVEPLPAASLTSIDFEIVEEYMNSTKTPVGTILKSQAYNESDAPVVAFFSSRGPNSIFHQILKPDVTAPGIDILAGYSPIAPITASPHDNRRVQYNIISGTSMACPHVTGIAAYVKSFHPYWSPSAIQSAIMTTANELDRSNNEDLEFSYGSGQVNPIKAVHPGLVYEAMEEDYVKLLCRMGFDEKKLGMITGDNNTSCPKEVEKDPIMDFNYPSFTGNATLGSSFMMKFRRTVTNVGLANSTYKAQLARPADFQVKVEPEVLSFKSLYEKKSFNVTISAENYQSLFSSTALIWSDGFHSVRTPIIFHTFIYSVDDVDGRVSK